MISKELLSEVLAVEVFDIVNDKNTPINMFQYEIKKRMLDGSGIAYREINIHELAYKCKEWAWKNNYRIVSAFLFNKWKIKTSKYSSDFIENTTQFKADTEPEAIFKACQWILENR